MVDFSNIIQEINTNLPDNNNQDITAARLRTTLIDLTEAIEEEQTSFENRTAGVYLDINPDLPEDYDCEIEFLQISGGDSYFDLGVSGSNVNSVILDAEYSGVVYFLFGSRSANNVGQYCFNVSSVNSIRYDYGTGQSVQSGTANKFTYNNSSIDSQRHIYQFDGRDAKFDGTTVCQMYNGTFDNNLNLHLFGLNNGGTHFDMELSGTNYMKVYSFKLYRNDVLVRDMRPVKKSGMGCMYDFVNNQLYSNQGTTPFICGPEIPIQTEIEPDSHQYLYTYDDKRIFPVTRTSAVYTDNGINLDTLLHPRPLVGKTWVGFGDSLVLQDASRYPGITWSPFVEQYTGLVFKNCGIGSTCLAGNSTNSFWQRINSVEAYNPEVVTILGGANDLIQGIQIGTEAEFTKTLANKDKTNFLGAYSYIIETLLTWKPALKIYIMTTTYAHNDGVSYSQTLTYSDFAEASRQVARYYGLPIIDLYYEQGINKVTQSTYTSDGIHFNTIGAKACANLVISKINETNWK